VILMAKTYEFREVANIFPLIEGKEFSVETGVKR